MGLLERLWRGRNSTGSGAAPRPPADVTRLVESATEHQRAGHIDAAIEAYESALRIDPANANAWFNLGNCQIALGREDDACSSWLRAVEEDPGLALAHANLGTLLTGQERYDEAIDRFERARSIDAGNALVRFNLGTAQLRGGRTQEAIASLRSAVALDPAMAEGHFNLANALDDTGQPDEALSHYQLAVNHRPGYAEAHHNLGNLQRRYGDVRAAIASYRSVLACNPDFLPAVTNLGLSLTDVGEFAEAEALLNDVATMRPSAAACVNLGGLRMALGRIEDAIDAYRRGVEMDPHAWSAHSGLLWAMNFGMPGSEPERLAQARAFGSAATAAAQANYATWPCAPTPRRLRIGFVSGDLRSHPVGYFAVGLLENLDASRFDALAYSTFDMADDLTERIAARVSSWTSISGMSDAEAAQRIHDDGVHILIDLSGHTAHNRLSMFAHRPAPVQASWLGYFATTGLQQMDYLLADAHVVAPSEEDRFVERIVRLPDSYLCFSVPAGAPPVSALPCIEAGHTTFGSFNSLAKVNDAVVALWARVLHAVPGSRLLLKNLHFNDAGTRQAFARRFASAGIDASRLVLEGSAPRHELLASYGRVDVALDPFPYPGGTTSVEALYQGVPVLTRRGDRFLSHVGETIARTAGLEEWIAEDDDEYVAKAVAFAANVEALSALREALRERVLGSPLFDAARFARGFERALVTMWDARGAPRTP
jgi:predicted O-linked N-acetylglucosamine transferase (SPINDLY family)